MSPVRTEGRHDQDDVLYQTVVDDEFRNLVTSRPEVFGLAPSGLPTAVEPLDDARLDMVSANQYVTMCKNTCTTGPITIICDGTTK